MWSKLEMEREIEVTSHLWIESDFLHLFEFWVYRSNGEDE